VRACGRPVRVCREGMLGKGARELKYVTGELRRKERFRKGLLGVIVRFVGPRRRLVPGKCEMIVVYSCGVTRWRSRGSIACCQ
jgi:hypothetical protein